MRKILLLLLLSTSCFGADYYLSINGNDANPCSLASPCASFQHVDILTAPGDTVHAHAGNYILSSTWVLSHSGSPGNPITYTPYGDGAVTITMWNLSIKQSISMGGTPFDPVAIDCGVNCQAYKLHTPLAAASTNFFEDYIYNNFRRPRNAKSFLNGLSPQGDTRVCVGPSTITQVQADAACTCPSEVTSIGQHCAIQATPCNTSFPTTAPYLCFNKFLYKNTDINCNWKGITLGDVEVLSYVYWTAEKYPITNAGCGNNVTFLKQSTAAPTANGITGFPANHPYLIDNLSQNDGPIAGTWYLDRCPINSTCTTPEASWDLYIFADTSAGENPNTDANQFFPSGLGVTRTTGDCAGWLTACGDGQLIRANGIHDVTFLAADVSSPFQITGDNFTVPRPLGLPDITAQPLITAAVSFQNCTNITIQGIQIFHIQGGGLEFEGTCKNFHILNSAVYDTNAFGVKIGKQGLTTDTDDGVPNNWDIQNTVIAYTGQVYPSGESMALHVGNSNRFNIWHNDVFGWYSGGIEIGDGLNLGACNNGTNDCYNTFAFDVGWNNVYGRCSSIGRCFAEMNDFSPIHMTSNHARSCPKPLLTKPILDADFCGIVHDNYFHDAMQNYNIDSTHVGAVGIYPDQGTSHVLFRNNYVVRIGHTGVFQNGASTPSFTQCKDINNNTTPCDTLPQYNRYTNNVFAFIGAAEGTNTRFFKNAKISNKGAFEADHNVFVLDSSLGTNNQSGLITIQDQPGSWACFDDDGVTPISCSLKWDFHDNITVDIANDTFKYINCKTSTCPTGNGSLTTTNYNFFTGIPWGLTGEEEIGSLEDNSGQNLYDVHMINPVWPNDNFHLSIWPGYLAQLGFDNTFDYLNAGRQTNTVPFTMVPSQPTLQIKRFINQTTDFMGNYVPVPITTWSLKAPAGQYSTLTQRH